MRRPRPNLRRPAAPSSLPARRPSPGDAPREEESGPILDHVAPPAELARATAEVASAALQAAFGRGRRPEPVVSDALRKLRGVSIADRLFVSRSIDALFRWWGWIDPLRLGPIEARLLIAVLLDRTDVPEPCRLWARAVGVDPRCLQPIGGAPNWARRAEAFRRLVERPRATTEPWTLFPRWLRDELLEPPGEEALKHRLVALLHTLQRPPLPWLRVSRGRPAELWAELQRQGLPVSIHPSFPDAASVPPSTVLQGIEPFRRGDLVAQDLGSLAVVAACDAEPGERWWYAGHARGATALLLADRMRGKGTLVVGELEDRDRIRTARMARKGPHTNVSTRGWDGHRVVGKPSSYHGVLLEPPGSGIGLWRREPASRWFVDRTALDRRVEEQARLLDVAARGVRPSGVLIYAVPSLARSETVAQIDRFLSTHPDFQLDPFPDPLDGSPTPGTAILWPDRADSDAWYLARLIRSGGPRSALGESGQFMLDSAPDTPR
ncbi:RsmB/NOP family class I SAM-dependent RNA methyltransferase [Tautonia sociabilis]|uniref:SAM-dependent MTase RsmB/NOP-type domain-containing protein n=1 Tax=Tautonia sociabilis TaxID=2080755 RepID=A0A432MLV6_9BACT|nr:hypothetical protein [Tautonia sociabilis]RUL88382.1 hypothetical protein TsocGM_07610 [Tautonia sociabilis]